MSSEVCCRRLAILCTPRNCGSLQYKCGHRMLCCDSQVHLPMRLRPRLHHDSMASLLASLLFVLRSILGQTCCLAEGGLIDYKPYTNHLKRARVAPVRDDRGRRGRLKCGGVVSVVSCWRFRCRTDVNMADCVYYHIAAWQPCTHAQPRWHILTVFVVLRQCIFPSPAILDARSAFIISWTADHLD